MHLDKIQIRVWIRSRQNTFLFSFNVQIGSKDERTRVSVVRPSPCPRFSEMPVSEAKTLSVSVVLKNLVFVSESEVKNSNFWNQRMSSYPENGEEYLILMHSRKSPIHWIVPNHRLRFTSVQIRTLSLGVCYVNKINLKFGQSLPTISIHLKRTEIRWISKKYLEKEVFMDRYSPI